MYYCSKGGRLRVEATTYAPDDSPHSVQEVILPSKNPFPRNNGEYFKDLLTTNPIISFMENSQLVTDGVRAGLEWWELRRSLIFEGEGAPKGEGNVVIAGGFGTNGFNYFDTSVVFERLGYTPHVYIPNPGINIAPVEQTVEHFVDFLETFDGEVKLIGHSKGGLLAFAAYAVHRDRFLEKVSHVVFAGSPRPERVNFGIGSPYFGTQILFRGDDFKFADEVLNNVDIENIDGTFVTAIEAVGDPVIQGQLAGALVDQFEVESSHLGLLVNSEVLTLIANRFADVDSILSEAA